MRPDRGHRAARRLIVQAIGATLPLIGVLVFRIPYGGLAVRLWLVALGAISISALTERALAGWEVADGPGLRVRWGWWRRPRPERTRPLEELEHAVDFSLGTAFDLHFRLRPHLRRIAQYRLAARGVQLDTQPQRAGEIVGPDAWELIRPDRPEPEDRNGPGTDLPTIRRVVEQLDEI